MALHLLGAEERSGRIGAVFPPPPPEGDAASAERRFGIAGALLLYPSALSGFGGKSARFPVPWGALGGAARVVLSPSRAASSPARCRRVGQRGPLVAFRWSRLEASGGLSKSAAVGLSGSEKINLPTLHQCCHNDNEQNMVRVLPHTFSSARLSTNKGAIFLLKRLLLPHCRYLLVVPNNSFQNICYSVVI